MPHCTIREYLNRPNPELVILPNAASSSRDSSAAWPNIDAWQNWTDFVVDAIEVLFGAFLDTRFDLADVPPLPKAQRFIRDERSFEFVLTRWNNIIVNEALRVAGEYFNIEKVYWTVGSVVGDTGTIIRPDWAAVTNGMLSGDVMWSSLVPGDTKFSKESFLTTGPGSSNDNSRSRDDDELPQSSPLLSDERYRREHFRACLEQVNYYAFRYKTRYCYIISNQELVILRRTLDLPASSSTAIATTRARRQLQAGDTTPTPRRKTFASPTFTSTSSPPFAPSLISVSRQLLSSDPQDDIPSSSFSHSVYSEHGRPDENMANPDFVSIPWKTEQGLTINMALFALHVLASLSCSVKDEYPELHEDTDYVSILYGPNVRGA